MRLPGRAGFGLLVAASLAACQSADDAAARSHGSEPVVRDSAGITIVESPGPAWPDGAGWRLSSEPAFRIGTIDGPPEQQLFQVRGAVRLSDGTIAVANGGHEVRYYRSDGRHLRTVGREGEGPGEFRGIVGLYRLPGDSLLMWDVMQRRASVLAPDGSFRRDFRLAPPGEGRTAGLVGLFSDGSLLTLTRGVAREPPAGLVRDTTILMRYADPGTPTDTVARLPGRQLFFELFDEGFTVHGLLFGRDLHFATAGARLVVGVSDAYEIQLRTGAGEIERLIRRAHEPRPVRRADVEAGIAAELGWIDEDEVRRRHRNAYRRMPVPSTMPAFSGLRAAADGHLWVRQFAPPGSAANAWDVFDPEGRYLGPAELPPAFRPTEIGEDYLLGVREDELDVEYVELYRIEKAGRGAM